MHRLALPFLWLAGGVACLLPRSWAHRAGRRIGALAYHCMPGLRERAADNVQAALGVGVTDALRIARASFRQAGAAYADLLRGSRLTPRLVDRDVEIPEATRDTLEELRAGDATAVLICPRYGNWEFALLALRHCDLPVEVEPGPSPSPLLARYRRTANSPGEVRAMPYPGSFAAGSRVYLMYFLPLGRCRYRFVLKGPMRTPAEVASALDEAIRDYPEAAWWGTARTRELAYWGSA